MGLISDRKAKKQKEKEKEKELEKLKKVPGLVKGGGGVVVGRYPAGYYTTPAPAQASSWSQAPGHALHPAQPRPAANVNPRYQTWVAPRKQPHLGQLVSEGTAGCLQ